MHEGSFTSSSRSLTAVHSPLHFTFICTSHRLSTPLIRQNSVSQPYPLYIPHFIQFSIHHPQPAATMQRFQELTQKFTNLSVNKSSHHPTPADSAKVPDSLFGKESPIPSSPVANRNKALPVISNVVVRHSSAFNSERATGMSKVQQLQFVELLKKMIIGE